ncbi:MAG: acyl-CoA dehydrogenase [Promethearchaeota archaeon]|nr:MAG: acyl-CoA dehydrogenase [Candidatus Lokiarchaeota archaeon]
MAKFITQAINDETLEKLNLENRYNFLNACVKPMLNSQEMGFLKQVEEFCLNYEKNNKITHGSNEDIYDWIFDFGKEGYISRAHKFDVIDLNYNPWGLTVELMRALALCFFDPQLLMMFGATILGINPIEAHHENIPIRLQALREIVTGQSPSCILITEPERGSDAVHQLTTCEEQPDGSLILNGDKIFNTNAPKSKWAVAYATGERNVGTKMAQVLIDTSWEGWNCERVYIPWVPKLYLGRENLVNLRVPKDYILGGIGKGRGHLFEGLVVERIMIATQNICEAWNSIAHAAIYSNMRKQFEQPIIQFQGVGMLLAELFARTQTLTYGLLKFCEDYDELALKYGGEHSIPPNISRSLVAIASQFKYTCADLSKNVCYEAGNLMGGAGLCDNTLMHDLINISRIQEIVGGSRQIQLYIISNALSSIFKVL